MIDLRNKKTLKLLKLASSILDLEKELDRENIVFVPDLTQQQYSPLRIVKTAMEGIQIEKTLTNRKINKIEQDLEPKLERIFKQIVQELNGQELHIQSQREKHGQQISDMIRSLVTQVYQIGQEYIGRSLDIQDSIFLTEQDLRKISEESNNLNEMFWNQVRDHVIASRVRQEDDKITKLAQEEEESGQPFKADDQMRLLDILTHVKLLLNAAISPILAFSLIDTIQQIRQRNQELIERSNVKFVFVTERDASVCPICQPLDAREFDLDDPAIIIPRIDTHPRCRCRLLLKRNGVIISK